MSLANYTDLQAAVKDWINRFDTTVSARVPDFITLGEQRIWRTGARVVRSQWGIKHTTLTIPANQNWAALPSDWLAFERIRSDAEPRIEYMPPAALEDLPSPGKANRYSIEGGRLLYGQTPAADLTLTVKYYQHPGNLSTVGTTWLLVQAPGIYLNAALIEAAIFIKNSDKIAEFGALLDKDINGLASSEAAAAVSGGALRAQGRL